MLHSFTIAGRSVKLWQGRGESYEHVLMKALGYAMFVGEYPDLGIERRVGLRYKPDLIAPRIDGGFDLWGECGVNSLHKTAWILKHAGARRLILFKMAVRTDQLAEQLRRDIPPKYRSDGRLAVVNFAPEVIGLTANRQIEKVAEDWFSLTVI